MKQLILRRIACSFLILAAFGFVRVHGVTALTAEDATTGLSAITDAAELTTGGEDQLYATIGKIINTLLSLLGLVFFFYTLWAGWLWMTAKGDPKATEKATKILTECAVGILIILSAAAISNFVIAKLTTAAA